MCGVLSCVCAQSWEQHVSWVDSFTQYLGHGQCLNASVVDAQRPAAYTPARLIWCTAPLLLSPIWAEADRSAPGMTTSRHYRFGRYAQSAMEGMGVPIVDTWAATQGRWEDVLDGVHYVTPDQSYHGMSRVRLTPDEERHEPKTFGLTIHSSAVSVPTSVVSMGSPKGHVGCHRCTINMFMALCLGVAATGGAGTVDRAFLVRC